MSMLSAFGSMLRFFGIWSEIYEFLLFGQFVAALAVAITYQSLILMLQVSNFHIFSNVECAKTMLLQECSPTKLRGLLSCTSEICVALFSVFGTFVGMRSIFGDNLRLLVGSAILPGLTFLIL